MPTVDMLDVMQFKHPGMCLSGSYTVVRGDLLIVVKNPKPWQDGTWGYPLDVRRFDRTWIYDQETENSWDTPEAIKLHVGNGGYGNRMCKRFVDRFPHTVEEVGAPGTPSSPLYYITSGKMDYARKDAGPVSYTWFEPRVQDWGGSVGKVLTYPVNYVWSGGKANCEQYYFSPGWGLLKWRHLSLVGGRYVVVRPEDDPPVNNILQTVKDWQRTWPKLPDLTGFSLPFMSRVPLS